ncbi:mRNA-decapping enzyme subunit 2 [Ophidiomyces ophidiicola]|nr:mRNA-decapping enzyme subunit 2 [Ophidiomyces ophidiicola]
MPGPKMKLEDWLDDLCVRFIINLPHEELESVERICFQVEEAQWFYEDFIRPLDPNLPSLNLRSFSLLIFQHCPLMSQWSHYHHSTAFSEFLAYKTRVPVRGAILLNEAMDEVILVKGWKKTAGWSFPRGKINKDEKDFDCAVREVYEETGFDIRAGNLVKNEETVKHIDISMREQNMRLYVIRGVPKNTHFEPRTRKEISKIEWYKLSELPTQKKVRQEDQTSQAMSKNKFYMVAPFLGPLKKWIATQKKRGVPKNTATQLDIESAAYTTAEESIGAANGNVAPSGDAIEAPIPMGHPTLPAGENPSSQLKRLLNIGCPVPRAPAIADPVVTRPDSSNGSTLLELLRKGSDSYPAYHREGHPHTQLSSANLPSVGPLHPPPTQHSQSNVNITPNALPVPLPGVVQPPLRSLHPPHINPTDQVHQSPVHNLPGNEFSQPPQLPAFGPFVAPHSHRPWLTQPPGSESIPQNLQGTMHFTSLAAQKPVPPPYYPTLPQSNQTLPPSDTRTASIPPASKLPPPKLTSHSLALLNVFKSNNSQIPTAHSQEMPSDPQFRNGTQKMSDHRENLLSLLKVPAPPSMPFPAAHTQTAPQPTNNMKMSKPQDQVTSQPQPPQLGKDINSRYDIGQCVNNPAAKSLPTQSLAKQSPRGQQHQLPVHPQHTARPNITILPRPSSVKNESIMATKVAATSQSPQKRNVKISEITKPFKPRILRRPDKDNLDACLPARTVVVSAFTKPKKETLEEEPETAKETPQRLDYDRRQSQPNSQKETLLSLFGKADPPETKPASYRAELMSHFKSPAQDNPAGDAFHQSTAVPPPCTGESQPPTHKKATSPVDKEFLLGYLNGVAMGKR